MGLIKTMSQSSAELKNILDRLAALESGETFATKEMFESLKNADNSDNIMLANYPVGSIYMSVNNTNPSTLFGGTWVAWGAGRVPVGVGTGKDSNETSKSFTNAEETAGEYTHKLTISEMPAHSHGGEGDFARGGWDTSNGEEYGGDYPIVISLGDNYPWQGYYRNFRTTTEGGGNAHENRPPYFAVYFIMKVV